MLPPFKDPKGYYAALEVSPTASQGEIKAAFRAKAKELHPDHNPSLSANWEFSRLQEAYSVLSSTDKRQNYDAGLFVADETTATGAIQLKKCSRCHCISDNLRYVVFMAATTRKLMHRLKILQGIYCPECAKNTAIQASLKSWIYGWWGLPFGIFITLAALWNNLVGGMKPARLNARLLIRQAETLYKQRAFRRAMAVIKQAAPYLQTKAQQQAAQNLVESLVQAGTKQPPQQPDPWRFFNRATVVQLAPFMVCAVIIATSLYLTTARTSRQQTSRIKAPAIAEQEQIRVIPLPENNKDAAFYYYVTAEMLRILQGPGHQFGIVDEATHLQTVRITGLVPNTPFVRIKTQGGKEGFVLESYLEKLPAAQAHKIIRHLD